MSWDPLGIGEGIADFFGSFFTEIDEVVQMAQVLPNGETGVLQGGRPIMFESFPANALWNTATGISREAVAPVAATFLGIFLSIEIFNMAQRTKIDSGLDLFYQILMVVLKMSICLFFIENMSVIILACFQIAQSIIQAIGSFNLSSNIDVEALKQGVSEHYKNNTDFIDWGMLGTYICVLISSFAASVCSTLAKLILMIRFIEIYIFTAMAPLAFATLPSQEYSGIGKTFIKRMLALALQGVMIVIACSIYLTVVNAMMANGVEAIINNPLMGSITLLGYNLLLVIVLFQTGGWSKQLLQVH